MSVAMLSSVRAHFYPLTATWPVTRNSATASASAAPSQPVQHQQDDRPRFQENTLVSAMMAAFAALGVGQPAATATATPTTPVAPASTDTSAAASTTPSTATPTTSTPASTAPAASSDAAATTTPAATPAASTSATTPTDATSSSTTLEKAVNEFAHVLYSMLHQQGHSEHSGGNYGGEHAHSFGSQQQRGYNGLVQRLEQLAQSLGTTAPAGSASSTPAAASTPVASSTPAATDTTSTATTTSTTTAADQTSTAAAPAASTSAPTTPASSTPISSTNVAVPRLSRGMTHLLAAFTKVMNLLQPTSAPTSSSTTSTGTALSTASATDQLKLFLTTLAHSLQSGAIDSSSSPVGSRVNLSA